MKKVLSCFMVAMLLASIFSVSVYASTGLEADETEGVGARETFLSEDVVTNGARAGTYYKASSSGATMRQYASSSAAIVCYLPAGRLVVYHGTATDISGNEWYYVSVVGGSDGLAGWYGYVLRSQLVFSCWG